LGNRSNGKRNRERRCLLFQAQTLDLRGDRHRDRQRKTQRREEIKIKRGRTERKDTEIKRQR
jgi:hypothetical protein